MSLFSGLVPPSRRGEKQFERARAAQVRGDDAAALHHFRNGAEAFDRHLQKLDGQGKTARNSHLTMAGICYTRLDRHDDALRVLDEVVGRKDIPDAYLYAGISAARLGDVERTRRYWEAYPPWADQRIVANELKDQLRALRKGSPLKPVCDAVDDAVRRQDLHDRRKIKPFNDPRVQHRGY